MGKDGKPLASPELVVIIFAQRENAAHRRGRHQPQRARRRPDGRSSCTRRKSLEGRMFTPGTSEIVIGNGAGGALQGHARSAGTVHFARRDWTVVGVMDQGGSAYDSEVWGDVDQFMDAFARRPAFSSITMRLKDPSGAGGAARRASRPTRCCRRSRCKPEVDYWAAQSEATATFVQLARPVRRGHLQLRRGARRDDHDVRAGGGAHARDRDAARARLPAARGAGVVRGRVGDAVR